ncbi:class I SAM-dependent methyltransferase [Cohnella faecalis]|uniref:Class I SAM-dependent methyltransferase n=1 Tax=Cohnella faecalis TaxID=2315694 RepID=A0A398CG24_9BACL|nr:class I SAM-dependent methyltransferase [Cohnella faecalis]RIE01673.1 class I SAM-dependent methyltransferase [Cohnella faecalis]RIE04594.1 class I SAM-dependent methyltransferase [Cohnella faecalis]
MNEKEYMDFYDRVGPLNGWDFSKLKCRVEGTPANLYEEVKKCCKQSDLLLDIGTGGGEAILALHEAALLLVGIDRSSGMIQKARDNLRHSGLANVRFIQMDAERLDFPEQFFDVVSCRHSEFSAHQAAKVLSQGGIFFSQQVSEGDKINLKQAFGRGQSYGDSDGNIMKKYIQDITEAGFTEIQSFEYDSEEYYQTPEDLIFLLKHTPIIPNYGQDRDDFEILHAFIAENQTAKGIRTNSKRFILKARK